jgi:hypothetical protein
MKTYLALIPLAMVIATGLYTHQAGAETNEAYNFADIELTLQYHKDTLDNHEARISAVENNLGNISTNSSADPPNSQPVAHPTAPINNASPSPQAHKEPDPIVVTAYEQIPIEGTEDIDCKLTYSDSTTHQWHWRTVTENQGTTTVHTGGICDARILGHEKP